MRVIRQLAVRPARAQRLALAIGVFDGVHRGHQAVLAAAKALARREGWLSAALSFEGPPEAVLGLPVPPRLGHPLDDEAQMRAGGLERCYRVPFTRALGALGAEAFVRKILCERLRCGAVVVGRGFRFGAKAKGDVALLRRLGRQLGFQVREVPPLLSGGHLVSSTRLRHAVQAGRLAEAARLLGRPWTLWGSVVRGQGLGAKIGFPTANLRSLQAVLPPRGVWAGRCRIRSAQGPGPWKRFAANIGVRPTLGAGLAPSVELHLIGFQGSLRGKVLQAEFQRKLRAERRFPSREALSAQIARDLSRARRLSRV